MQENSQKKWFLADWWIEFVQKNEMKNMNISFLWKIKKLYQIDRWKDKEALDIHHKSEMMKEIAELRDKYQLHMKVEMFNEVSK